MVLVRSFVSSNLARMAKKKLLIALVAAIWTANLDRTTAIRSLIINGTESHTRTYSDDSTRAVCWNYYADCPHGPCHLVHCVLPGKELRCLLSLLAHNLNNVIG